MFKGVVKFCARSLISLSMTDHKTKLREKNLMFTTPKCKKCKLFKICFLWILGIVNLYPFKMQPFWKVNFSCLIPKSIFLGISVPKMRSWKILLNTRSDFGDKVVLEVNDKVASWNF